MKGPKGQLSYKFHPSVSITKNENQIIVERKSEDPFSRSVHGTTRALLNNMVKGVTEGFTEELEIVGIVIEQL